MTIKSIIINKVNTIYTADHIAFTLLIKEICHVSSITLIPQIDDADIYYIAYIDIDSYCDTEAAYEFIHHIKNGIFTLHHDNDPDNLWTFQLNTHNFGGLSVGSFTTFYNYKYNHYDHDQLLHTPIQYPTFHEYPTFEQFLNLHDQPIHNYENVTLRPHQLHYITDIY